MSCKYSERIVFGFLHFQINHYNVHAIIFCIIHLDVYLLELINLLTYHWIFIYF